MKKSELKKIIKEEIRKIIKEERNPFKSDYISPAEYKRMKTSTMFHKEDWKWDSKRGLYKNLKNKIREGVITEGKYRGLFSVEHGSGNSAKEWKEYIKNIPGVKVSTYPSAYAHHTAVDVIVNDKATINKVIKKWREYGIDWPEANDFEPIGQYSRF